MNNYLICFIVAAIVAFSHTVLAKNSAAVQAAHISIGSDGRAIDGQAIKKVRRLNGDALSNGVIDVFIVNMPKKGSPIAIEGGLNACVQVGFGATAKAFNDYLKKLRLIPAKPGTFLNVKVTDSCFTQPKPPAMCGGIAGLVCPANQICIDDPNDSCNPKQGGADCSGICKAK